MVHKHLISPSKLRKLPGQFSWIDQRLVRDRHIDRLSHPACALYLFLLTVADAQGLSYYSELSICRRLSMAEGVLRRARRELVQHGLVAYQKPLYQVLALDAPHSVAMAQTSRMSQDDKPMAIKDIFKHIAETLS